MTVRYVPMFDNRAIRTAVGLMIPLGSPWATARLLGSKPGDTIDVTVFALIFLAVKSPICCKSDDGMRWLFLTSIAA
jgi:hypothetical protein